MPDITQQAEIQYALGRISAKLDELLRRANSHDEERAKSDGRLEALERWRALLMGAWAVLAIGLGGVFKFIMDLPT